MFTIVTCILCLYILLVCVICVYACISCMHLTCVISLCMCVCKLIWQISYETYAGCADCGLGCGVH